MLTAGSQVAGYRIVRVLGSGGMGSVYLAEHPSLPRRDALKVLSAELSRDPDFRARFVREADVASALDHPNIVAVYDRGETDGQLWIAMQFVDGTDADGALREGLMTPQRAVHIVAEVGKALDHAHQRNVVHRDVKPANFLLSGTVGPDERVLLGDFGIARALDDVGLTVTGAVMATVAYAAPEVLSGQPFDRRADLYSLGCTLFRLLTGKTPFSAANGMAAVMMARDLPADSQRTPRRRQRKRPSLPRRHRHRPRHPGATRIRSGTSFRRCRTRTTPRTGRHTRHICARVCARSSSAPCSFLFSGSATKRGCWTCSSARSPSTAMRRAPLSRNGKSAGHPPTPDRFASSATARVGRSASTHSARAAG